MSISSKGMPACRIASQGRKLQLEVFLSPITSRYVMTFPTALAGAVLGLGAPRPGDPMDKPELAAGYLASVLPPGCYHLADDLGAPELAAVAWGLGAYRFRRYKSGNGEEVAQLKVPRGVDHA